MGSVVDFRLMSSEELCALRFGRGGYRAIFAYISSLLWAEKYNTDTIPRRGLQLFGATTASAKLLVELGLWEKIDTGGWRITHPGILPKPEQIGGHKHPVVYLISDDGAGAVKVGSSRHPTKRLAQLQTGHPRKLRLLGIAQGADEKEAHRALAEYRLHGEWFALPDEVIDAMLEAS